MQTLKLDTGQQIRTNEDPYWIEYKCPRCGRFAEDTVRHSHFDGERWVSMRYCWDCIEAAI